MKKQITIVLLILVTLSCADIKKNKPSDSTKIDEAQNNAFLSANIDGENFYTDAPIYYSAQNIITLAAVSKDKT